MATVDTTKVTDVYTRRALLLLRYVNSLAGKSDKRLRQLGRLIIGLLVDLPGAQRGRDAALRTISEAVTNTYSDIALESGRELEKLLEIEAEWAIGTGGVAEGASADALKKAFARMLVMGAPLGEQFARAGMTLAFNLRTGLRTALLSTSDFEDLRAVVGLGSDLGGGMLDQARRAMSSLEDTAVHTAAYAGRMASFRASGIDALMWHSIMDLRTTIGCALRDGRLYSLDFEPIGHDIPIERPPPRHYNCRSILIPMLFPGGKIPDKLIRTTSFADFLGRHSAADQDHLLGAGRAAMWRKGTITLNDLLNQRGQELTLGELRATHD